MIFVAVERTVVRFTKEKVTIILYQLLWAADITEATTRGGIDASIYHCA